MLSYFVNPIQGKPNYYADSDGLVFYRDPISSGWYGIRGDGTPERLNFVEMSVDMRVSVPDPATMTTATTTSTNTVLANLAELLVAGSTAATNIMSHFTTASIAEQQAKTQAELALKSQEATALLQQMLASQALAKPIQTTTTTPYQPQPIPQVTVPLQQTQAKAFDWREVVMPALLIAGGIAAISVFRGRGKA